MRQFLIGLALLTSLQVVAFDSLNDIYFYDTGEKLETGGLVEKFPIHPNTVEKVLTGEGKYFNIDCRTYNGNGSYYGVRCTGEKTTLDDELCLKLNGHLKNTNIQEASLVTIKKTIDLLCI
jgi:hypothetical protein